MLDKLNGLFERDLRSLDKNTEIIVTLSGDDPHASS